ncbi:hypothetical protein Btru_062082 [Bulinus truncatus]|nr:hypothetical protein Btru_062082 [Bulinus truncatus]
MDVTSTMSDVTVTMSDVIDVTSTTSDVTSTMSDITSPTSDVTSPMSDVTSTTSDVTSTTPDVTSTTSDVTSPTSDVTSPTSDVTSPTSDVTSTTSDVTSTTSDVTSTTSDVTSTTFIHTRSTNANTLNKMKSQWNTSVNLLLTSINLTLETGLDKLYSRIHSIDILNMESYYEGLIKNLTEDNSRMESVISFLAQPMINDHDFQYTLNQKNACAEFETEVLIVVPSAPDHFTKRSNIRNGTIGSFVNNDLNRAKMLFFIGMTTSESVQQDIVKESQRFNDIIQEDFKDVYRNIRYKAVSMLKWASTFCRNASYVIRTDDDVKTDVAPIVSLLKATSSVHDNFIFGKVRQKDHPQRQTNGKYALTFEEFPNREFPPYALGGLLAYPIKTVQLLYQAALRVPPVLLDDVYITGMCAPKIGAKLLSDSLFHFRH